MPTPSLGQCEFCKFSALAGTTNQRRTPVGSRVLVATVFDGRPFAVREVVLLFQTLRLYGGELAQASCVVYAVADPPQQAVDELEELGVALRRVEPVDPRCPTANKLRNLSDEDGFDWLVALDSDVVVARDFSAYVHGATSIRAKPVDHGRRLTPEQWRLLFDHFEIEWPDARFLTCLTLEETHSYFNSGVLIVPCEYVRPLRDAWRSYLVRILDESEDLPFMKPFVESDQFSLSLALVGERLPYLALPVEMNFPTHKAVHPALSPDAITPYLIHHHHRFTATGLLLGSKYPGIDAIIDRINRRRPPGGFGRRRGLTSPPRDWSVPLFTRRRARSPAR